ncbi:MAG: PadR family transcriptional regulator [Planctomycetota bacterium]|jgi:transcriptional regulator
MKFDKELLKGATETLVLAALADKPSHGYELVERLRRRSDGIFELGEGTLYPLLYKLEARGLIKGDWEPGSGQRKKRVYRLTARGRKQLSGRTEEWQELVRGMTLIVGGLSHA